MSLSQAGFLCWTPAAWPHFYSVHRLLSAHPSPMPANSPLCVLIVESSLSMTSIFVFQLLIRKSFANIQLITRNAQSNKDLHTLYYLCTQLCKCPRLTFSGDRTGRVHHVKPQWAESSSTKRAHTQRSTQNNK